jgi:hypothetical protein
MPKREHFVTRLTSQCEGKMSNIYVRQLSESDFKASYLFTYYRHPFTKGPVPTVPTPLQCDT